MQLVRLAVLGIIQGLTEFLPVSSSGHLAIFHRVLKVEADLGFDTAVHIGTGLAVLIFYFPKLLGYFKAVVAESTGGRLWGDSKGGKTGLKLVLLLLVTSVPAGFAGALLEDSIEAAFSSPWAISAFLAVTGAVLLFAGKTSGGTIGGPEPMKARIALLIGIAQAFALLPGISRSGMTISAGMALGLTAAWAVDYSMLASLPVIFGAFLLQASKEGGLAGSHGAAGIAVGVAISLVTGLLAISVLRKLAARKNFKPFAAWVFIAAIVNIGLYIFAGI